MKSNFINLKLSPKKCCGKIRARLEKKTVTTTPPLLLFIYLQVTIACHAYCTSDKCLFSIQIKSNQIKKIYYSLNRIAVHRRYHQKLLWISSIQQAQYLKKKRKRDCVFLQGNVFFYLPFKTILSTEPKVNKTQLCWLSLEDISFLRPS